MAPRLKALLCAASASVICASMAQAQQTTNPSEWSRPYGQAYGTETQAYVGARRAGNRVVINGIIQAGVGVSAQASAMSQASAGVGASNNTSLSGGLFATAGATAIGNQLNVVVNGNYNTVVINNRQTNNGDINANAGAVAQNNTSQQNAEARDNDG